MGEQRVSLRIQWVAVEEMWFIERICTCSNIYIYFDQSGMAMMRPWRSRSFEVHSNSIQNRGGFFGKILSQKFFVLSSSWFAIKVITNKYSYLTPSYLELFVSLIWTIHRKIQQSRFYECNVNLLIDFSKFVQWLRITFPLIHYLWKLVSEGDLDTFLERGSACFRRGRTDNLCQAAELSNTSPTSPISRSGSNLIFLQHRFNHLPMYVFPFSFPSLPSYPSTPFRSKASCRLNIILL